MENSQKEVKNDVVLIIKCIGMYPHYIDKYYAYDIIRSFSCDRGGCL